MLKNTTPLQLQGPPRPRVKQEASSFAGDVFHHARQSRTATQHADAQRETGSEDAASELRFQADRNHRRQNEQCGQ